MNSQTQPDKPSRNSLTILLLLAALGLALSPLVATAQAPNGQLNNQRVTDMTRIELLSSASNLSALAELAIAQSPADRPGYVVADVTATQRQALDLRNVAYDEVASFLLIEGQGLSGEASVTGSNSTDVSILGNQTVTSNANVSGAPLGKTVIRADVGLDIKYPSMCNIYIMVFHPSNSLWFHAWNGNQHPCTADLSKQWLGIHDFDFADINGQWHLQVQETAGLTQGYINYWFIRLYYQDNSTPTPTPTPKASLHRVFLPLIISD
jgi:subtilisin-like proprotein convertase family protein